MENKYYTPSIDEFHVGFEYEWKCDGTQTDWTRSICNILMNPLDVDCRRINDYRVKYLDKEDIESLGFKEDIYNGVKCFTKNNCQIFFFGDNVTSIDLFAGEFRNQYFRGLVKNKSELKKILNQITHGIISQ